MNADSISIESSPLPEYTLGPDMTACFGQPVTISATPAYDSINWYTESSFINDLPVITVTPDTTIGPREPIVLQATGGTGYEWVPSTGLSSPFIAGPTANSLSTTAYEVLVTDENDCQQTGFVTIQVNNRLFVPELFTPNDDGVNDHFRIYGDGIRNCTLRVYDRSGQPASACI